MIRRLPTATIALAVLLAATGLVLGPARVAQAVTPDTAPPLFANYYAAPGYYGGVPAQLYVAPRPTPPVVGHTYITYQALMPHEFLYPHSRTYWTYHPEYDNWSRTSVTWRRKSLDLGSLLYGHPKPTQPAPLSPMAPLLGTTRY